MSVELIIIFLKFKKIVKCFLTLSDCKEKKSYLSLLNTTDMQSV